MADLDTRCPDCRTPLPAHDSVLRPGSSPDPGDVAVCAYCACVAVYDDDLELVHAPDDVADDPAVARAVDAVTEHPGDWRRSLAQARQAGRS